MKIKQIYFFMLLGLIGMMSSCGDDEYVSLDSEYGSGTLEAADALLNVNSAVVSFQAGTPSYPLSFDLLNGKKAVTKINIYSFFEDAATGDVSEEVLFKSYAVGSELRSHWNEDITYDDLKAGISVNGGPLPNDQLAVSIGSGWKMRYEGETSDGSVIPFAASTIVAVLSPYAGLYTVIESAYFRIGADGGTWDGESRFIGSVDETTFSYNDAWGPFGWVGSSFTFSIDENTNEITVPLVDADGQLLNGNALFSGNRAVGCHTDAGHFASVPCMGSNVLEPNTATGKHIIKLTYGYFTDGSGPREFYELLQKN